MNRRLLLGAGLSLMIALPAVAQAPEPRKPLDLDRFMGRWHEILRTPNDSQKGCWAAWQVWARKPDGSFSIVQHCRKDSASGPVKQILTSARVIDSRTNAKFEASFFGGVLKRRYWVLDRADDYSWMIASSADGKYVSVLARTPRLPPAQVTALRRRAAAMGLNAAGLETVKASL